MKFREFKNMLVENSHFEIPKNSDFIENITTIESAYTEPTHRFLVIRKLLLPIMSAILIVFAIGYVSLNNTLASTITLDINPSVTLELNRYGKVLEIDSNNQDGSALISGIDYSGKYYTTVILELVQECILQGYTSDEEAFLLFGITASNYQDEFKYQTSISALLDSNEVNLLVFNSHEVSSGYTTSVTSSSLSDSIEATIFQTTNVLTTDAAIPNDSYNNFAGSTISDYFEYCYGTSNLKTIASDLEMTDAKMQLILTIMLNNTSYQSEDSFQILANMSLSQLFPLYYDTQN